MTYTALDASQHTQHLGAVPLSDPSNKQPAQAAPQKGPWLASAIKPAATDEQDTLDKEHEKLSKGVGKGQEANHTTSRLKGLQQGTRVSNDASAGKALDPTTQTINAPGGKDLQEGNGPGSSQQSHQPRAQAKQDIIAKGIPAHLPARQPLTSPAAVIGPQHQATDPSAEATGLKCSSGHADQIGPTGNPQCGLQIEEANAPFGLFPSTQQSTSQQASKQTAAAMPADQAAPSAGATAALVPANKQQQQLPHMSPSGSSSARPPQGPTRRGSDAHTPSNAQEPAGLNQQQLSKQQSQQAANAQATAKGSGVSQVEKQPTSQAAASAAVAKMAATKADEGNISAGKGWIPRRSHGPRSAAADQPALQGAWMPSPQQEGKELAPARKQDSLMHATDKASAGQAKAGSQTDAECAVGNRDDVQCIDEQQQQHADKSAEDISRNGHAGESSCLQSFVVLSKACKRQ